MYKICATPKIFYLYFQMAEPSQIISLLLAWSQFCIFVGKFSTFLLAVKAFSATYGSAFFSTCARLRRRNFAAGSRWTNSSQQHRRYAPSSSLLIFVVYESTQVSQSSPIVSSRKFRLFITSPFYNQGTICRDARRFGSDAVTSSSSSSSSRVTLKLEIARKTNSRHHHHEST